MPQVQVTASQVIYYKKVVEVPQQEVDELLKMQTQDGDSGVIEWLDGFRSTDEAHYGDYEDVEVTFL